MPEENLKTYHEKRNFKHTPEPYGRDGEAKENIFVIQKHKATNLHYDFRIEMEGVLKSWAVPKGPSTDPKVKRLALPTEDHPIEYAGFEGVIPEGYGAGTVMVWDTGTYGNLWSEKDADNRLTMTQAYEKGRIEIRLNGKKLKGGYALIRTGGIADRKWLLIKERDEYANKPADPVQAEPDSALTGRSLEEIAGQGGRRE
ncbi:MAG TPA: DNA polymerase ligase N-terminal domain-containing protein [Methanocellaceae archaeon]|jgi:DNA ligase D-like protein (predicted 3'-phosphoesterase)